MEKKKLKKIQLNKEVILKLNDSELNVVKGGIFTIFNPIRTGGGDQPTHPCPNPPGRMSNQDIDTQGCPDDSINRCYCSYTC